MASPDENIYLFSLKSTRIISGESLNSVEVRPCHPVVGQISTIHLLTLINITSNGAKGENRLSQPEEVLANTREGIRWFHSVGRRWRRSRLAHFLSPFCEANAKKFQRRRRPLVSRLERETAHYHRRWRHAIFRHNCTAKYRPILLERRE